MTDAPKTWGQIRDRATVAAAYRLMASPHEWTQDDSRAMAEFVSAALPRLKAAEDEAIYWRQDAAARLRTALALARAAEKRGDEDHAAHLRVSILMPTRAALNNALTGDIYWPLCEGCSKPLLDGDVVYQCEDAGEVHVDCESPQLPKPPEQSHRFERDRDYDPEGIAAALAAVTAYLREE